MLVTRAIAPDVDFLAMHRLAPARYPLLLESAAHGTAQGRWDLLLAHAGESLACATGSVPGARSAYRATNRAGRSAAAGRCCWATNWPHRSNRSCACRARRARCP
jgi:hypothetical protein